MSRKLLHGIAAMRLGRVVANEVEATWRNILQARVELLANRPEKAGEILETADERLNFITGVMKHLEHGEADEACELAVKRLEERWGLPSRGYPKGNRRDEES